mmetsp:Transcript_40309/g.88127  ORF Transcript_40309/g.88127 Transcript_40309/m.88127 type:complete len:131 (+) Transcript_40309:1-393(+)
MHLVFTAPTARASLPGFGAMVTRISPLKQSDGTGRDTYIILDKDFRSGRSEGQSKWKADLRMMSPRLLPHQKGYKSWYRASSRPPSYAPTVSPSPSSSAQHTLRSIALSMQRSFWVAPSHNGHVDNFDEF